LAFSFTTHKFPNFQPEKILALFNTVEHKAWSFLLDSCQQTSMDGRYDIIVHSPCLTYEFKQGVHVLGGDWTKPNSPKMGLHAKKIPPVHLFKSEILTSTCPYQNLAKLQETFDGLFDTTSIEKLDIPFIAGALGVFGYDGNTSSDNIKDRYPKQYKMPDISVGFYHSSIVYDNLTQSLYLFSIDETLLKNMITIIENLNASSPFKSNFSLIEPWQSNMMKDVYCEQFMKIEDYLRAGDCYQVNFAQRFHAHYEGSEWHAYCQLRKANNAPFSAYVRLPTSTILSLSPERFLSVKGTHVESKPIKGTRKRDRDPAKDEALADELLSAEKDRAENLMIVDLLRNDLSKHCEPHSVDVPKLFALESYPAVHHMVSTVVGKLRANASVYDLMKGAFPGGSITGAPKVRAMQIIQELEPDKRAIYCGTIGYIGVRGDMDTNICIRTLLAESNTSEQSTANDKLESKILYCWAGGGIVIDSQDTDEYLESLHKVAKILPILDKHAIANEQRKETY
jgi:para-aminobenzoate synthetase component 1